MKNMFMGLVLALSIGCQSNWRTFDTVLEVTAVSLLTVDWYQSNSIVKNCREWNPIIGECGERVPVNLYFPIVIALEILASRLISSQNTRSFMHGLIIGAEGATVYDNHASK